ncbi:MAG: molybdopterin-dependent oxidoreductase, partial [Trueperaceae bacterium]|nr:molybdopterin-dependent oxidoreductase [Trueperaceae bacterium]
GVGLGLFPWADAGAFGRAPSNVAWPPLPVHAGAAVGAFLLAWIASGGTPGAASRPGRRGALGWIVAAASGLAAGAGGPAAWAQSAFLGGVVPWARIRGLAPRITPADAHYEISKNLTPPRVREAGWRLRIDGLVTTPLSLSVDDLAALPSVTRPSTLVCVSNRVGGDLIGTSEWTGVRLRDLLEAAGVHPDAREVVAWAADNYDDSFPLDAARAEGTLVAYRHGGQALAPAHGFPARLLVPGIYGMKSVKWLRRIELRAENHLGYWATRGWSDVATVRTLSRVDTDVATDLGDGRWAVAGVAFAGGRGVARVDVSFDGGATWREADLEAAPSPYAWRRWAWLGSPDVVGVGADGTFDVSVRATDGRGVVQTAERTRPLPAGATGLHRRS